MKLLFAYFIVLILISADVGAVADEDGFSADTSSSAENEALRVWQSGWAISGFKFAYHGYENGVGFGGRNIKRIVSGNPEALREVNTFAKYQVPTFFTTLISAAALGWGLGTKDERFIYIGAGGIVVSFIFDQIGYSHLKKAVRLYNEGLE